MASKSKRKYARQKRKRRRTTESGILDPHVQVVLASVEAMFDTVTDLAGSPDPGAAAAAALVAATDEIASQVAGIEPATLIEVARLGALPWAPEGAVGVDPEAAVARAELLGLIALAVQRTPPACAAEDGELDAVEGVQPITNLVQGTLVGEIDAVLRLAQARDLAEADMSDPLAYVSALMRGAEIWVRNNSYPDMVDQTVRYLFAAPAIRGALKAGLGFDADEAISVLHACHEVQVDLMNDRMKTMYAAMQVAMESVGPHGAPDADAVAAARAAWTE